MTDQLPAGRFLWYELLTSDVEGAKAFYSRVMGWGTQPFEGSPDPYWLWSVGEKPVAGLMTLPEAAKAQGAPPHWRSYVYTPALDSTREKVESLGGRILVPTQEAASIGRFSVFQDPQGAVIGVLEPAEAPSAQPDKAPDGQISWSELATTDRERAFAFYSELFGWSQTDEMDMGGDAGIYQMYGASDGVTLGGIFTKPAEMPVSAWLYYVTVPDLDEAVGTTKSLGGQILNGPMDVPGDERIAQCMDPQGAAFALHARK